MALRPGPITLALDQDVRDAMEGGEDALQAGDEINIGGGTVQQHTKIAHDIVSEQFIGAALELLGVGEIRVEVQYVGDRRAIVQGYLIFLSPRRAGREARPAVDACARAAYYRAGGSIAKT